mgnify:CR=1 FL=1
MILNFMVEIRRLLLYHPRVLLACKIRVQAAHLFPFHSAANHMAAYPSILSTPYPICMMKNMPGPRPWQSHKTDPELYMNARESIPDGPESFKNGSGPSMNDSECHTNGFESIPNGFESQMNGSESNINGSESDINGFESIMNGSESHMNSIEFLMNGFETASLLTVTCPGGI